jgi:hypothetical protein
MKLGVFMLWTEMRTPLGGLQPGSAQQAEALSAVGLGQPFAHDDVIPEALQLGTLRSGSTEAEAPSEAARGAAARGTSKLSSSRKRVGPEKLAKVVSAVRAKRAASQPQPIAARAHGKSAAVSSARSTASKQIAAR